MGMAIAGVAISILILISGCVGQSQQGAAQEPAATVGACGNGVVEAGEDCDKSECPESRLCSSSCGCEAVEIPPIPE